MTPLLRDEAFFEPAGDIESNLLKKRKNYESYIGKLRGSKCYKILPNGYLAMLDADDLNHLLNENENNYIYVKMLRKVVGGVKKMIPVCLRCNDVGKSSAIVIGTSHFLPNDSIENELVKCKHEVVSKALYTHSIVDVVESQNKECVLLKNSSKIHLAACFDGKSYATIVCKLSRSSTKGKCNSCKGVKCGHLTRWNKELGSSLLPDKAANERGDDLEEDSEELDDEEIKVLNRATLKFPLTETTQALFREYDSTFYDEKEAFADLPILGQKCSSHGNEWSDENPVEMDWCFSDQVKIAHTSFAKQRERKVYFRKAVKCDCKLLYEGDENFLVRVGVQNKQNIMSELCRWSPMAFSLTSPLTLWKTDKLSTGFTIPTQQNVKRSLE